MSQPIKTTHCELEGWLGQYEILIFDRNRQVIERQKLKNRILNAGLNMLRDALKGDIQDVKLKYLALGASDMPIIDSQTQLGYEQFRTAWINQTASQTGQLQSTALVLDTEAVFNIREIGIFAGATATESANTGIMISRIIWSRDKTNLESIQFIRTDTINRG
ncbi:MAG: hypothetical protein SCK28_04535 [Bacillota bacterium]|nr:hypothetical protein [Bacillota bacterium]